MANYYWKLNRKYIVIWQILTRDSLANKLSLNLVKTEHLLIGSRSKINNLTSEPNIVINNRPIKRVTETKSQRILIDQFLSWDSHLDELCKKVAAGIGAIKRLRPY